MRDKPVTLVLALLALPTACLAKTPPKTLPPVRYVCEDGTRLRATFSAPSSTPGTAILEILGTGKRYTLAQAPSADGGRYASDGVELWDKGATAQFTQGGTPLSCRTKR